MYVKTDMNTKQLWTALTLNKVTNSYFDGVYSIDTLIDIEKKPKLIICNTEPSDQPGEHWVLFFFEEDSVDFYDSLGRDITDYGPSFITFVKNYSNNFKQCLGRTQPLESSLCGHYCLYYAYAKCNGDSMEKIIKSITSPENIVNFVHKSFYICNYYDCPLLQSCVEC